MEWTYSFLSNEQIVVIQTQGVADEASSLEMVKNIPALMQQYQVVRLLIDHSALSFVSGKIVDVYQRPQEIRGVGVPVKIKIAEVVLPEHKKHFDFLETVCRNRGFDFRIFNQSEAALAWLTKAV